MTRSRTIADMNATGWMHIYPQGQWHMPAEIRGTQEALIGLRDALTRAIDGNGVAEAHATSSDGEGYAVQIRRINVLNLLGPLPYDGGGFADWKRDWGDARHKAWQEPPDPFDPEIHRVVVYVDRDGGNASLDPPAPGMEAEGQDAKRLGAEHDSPIGVAEAPQPDPTPKAE